MCRTIFTNHTLCGHLSVETFACNVYLDQKEKKKKRSFLSKLFRPTPPPASCKQSDVVQTQFTQCPSCADATTYARGSARQTDIQRWLHRQLVQDQESAEPSSSAQQGMQPQPGRHHSPPRDVSIDKARRDARAAAQRHNNVPRGIIEEFITMPGSDINFLAHHSGAETTDRQPRHATRGQVASPHPRPPASNAAQRDSNIPRATMEEFITLPGSDLDFFIQHSRSSNNDREPSHQDRQRVLPPQPGPPPDRPLPSLPQSGLSRSNATANRGHGPRYPLLPSPSRPSTAPFAQEDNSQLWAPAAAGPSRARSHAVRQPVLWGSQQHQGPQHTHGSQHHQPRGPQHSQGLPRIDTGVSRTQRVIDNSGVSPIDTDDEIDRFFVPGSPSDISVLSGPRSRPQVRLDEGSSWRPPIQQVGQRHPQLSHVSSNLGRRIEEAEDMWAVAGTAEGSASADIAEAQEKYWNMF